MNPVAWTSDYVNNLLNYNYVQTRSPGGAIQWIPEKKQAADAVPDAHDPKKRHPPVMLTTDLALKFDPAYLKVVQKFKADPEAFRLAFAKAWFKLTHRDMGPRARYLGNEVPKEILGWQDPLPPVDHPLIDGADASALKAKLLGAGLTGPQLVRTAWASASSFRGTDMRGGANGARIRLAPQKDWAVNDPAELAYVLKKLEQVQADFNKSLKGGKKVSLADVIVLAGNAAVEDAAKKAGVTVTVPFSPGRTDAKKEQTDPTSFAFLEPKSDGFRNYYAAGQSRSPAEMLVDKANMLNLTVPEMTVLVGGLRVLNANSGGAAHGVFTATPGKLTNDFFVQLLDMSNKWVPGKTAGIYEGRDRKTDKVKWTATPVDLVFGSNSELRAIAEVYAQVDGKDRFVRDFVKAWTKVTNLDRFDIKPVK
jgi:catalase-peroxidase